MPMHVRQVMGSFPASACRRQAGFKFAQARVGYLYERGRRGDRRVLDASVPFPETGV